MNNQWNRREFLKRSSAATMAALAAGVPMTNFLSSCNSKKINFTQLLPNINGLSHAEITLACLDAVKETVLNEKISMSNQLILKSIKDRNAAYHK